MRTSKTAAALLAMALSSLPWVCKASAIEVGMSPVREAFRLGEPIEIRLSIRNKSNRAIQIFLAYPDHIGVLCTCRDRDVASARPVELSTGGRSPVLTLEAGEEHRRSIALRRYLRFKRAKLYAVDFLAEHFEPVSKENPKPRTFSTKGRFTFRVEPGPPDEERLRGYVRVLEAKDTGRLKAEEALEMLLWAEDPMVIGPIVQAAERMPNWRHHAIQALGRFFRQDRARLGILELATLGDMRALQAALRVYEGQKAKLPIPFCKAVLSSRSTAKTYHMLEFLSNHGEAEHVPLVKPLEKHSNPQIRELASKVIDNITNR